MEDRKKYPLSASDYILLEEVGQGVSAFVYRARCIPLNTIIAIKVLDLERINSNLDDIRREAQTMSLINHPNVLSAYCSFVVEQALWVVMPYMAGGSCLHIMKYAYPDGFEEAIIGSVLKESLKALEYLHSHGHIHRDVKAGNILVDVDGAVKLGDFGVSACMFDTGDRQRSRNTFVGTPCWMAPEVMEQVHGYDFRADIWSFGITALELAHGHAPFSKYPPMKVLLMTLQNSPPGLDYEKDKRFSKAFKEMIAMCLVKDPAKRPTAEKLLRHSFFKRVKSTDPIRNVLNGLSPLGQRLSELKMKDADMLAQKKMPYAEKEEMSQNEYKRGVSGWNFDIEDLKAQAALIPDDDDSLTGREENEQHSLTYSSDHSTQPLSQASITDFTYLVTLSSFRAESAGDAGEQITSASIPLPAPIENSVDVIKDVDKHSVKSVENELKAAELAICEEDVEGRKDEQLLRNLEEKECEREKLLAGGLHSSSGLPVPENVLCISEDVFRTRSFPRERTHSLPQSPHVLSREHRSLNGTMGLFKPPTGVEGLDKGQYVQRKGRFSVTSEDVDLIEASTTATCMRKSASMQVFTELSHSLQTPLPALRATTYSAAAILPYLQNILQQNLSQQDSISALMGHLSEGSNNNSLSPPASKGLSQDSSFGLCRPQVDSTSDRERQLLQQVAELQNRLSCLVDELQTLKSRNITLERQLSVIRNKEEEEKIEVEATSMEIQKSSPHGITR